MSVRTNAFPAVRASHAIGLAYGIAGLGNAAGPLIGGLLTETVGWRWMFWLNVPLMLAALAIGAWSITESFDEIAPRRIDLSGLALITVGIGLFTLTFDRAPTWGWVSATTSVAVGFSLAALAVFVVVENRVRWPLVDLSLLQNPRFTVLVVAGTIAKHRLRRHDLPCGLTFGLVYAFTTVATQAAVRTERAGEAAGGHVDRVGHTGRCRGRGVRNGAGNASARGHVACRRGRRHRLPGAGPLRGRPAWPSSRPRASASTRSSRTHSSAA